MLTFQSPRIEDKNWVKELFSYSQFQGCEYTFGNLYIWKGAQRAIVTEREEEMGNACFGGDMLLGK